MINDSALILRQKKELNEKLSYKYIFIDEYQDTSLVKVNMIQEIIKHTKSKLLVRYDIEDRSVDNVEVLLSKGMFNIAFRDVFVNIYVYGEESTVDLFDAFIVGEKERIPCFLNMFCTQCRIIFDIVKNV